VVLVGARATGVLRDAKETHRLARRHCARGSEEGLDRDGVAAELGIDMLRIESATMRSSR
jgi:hypothetical protein